MFEWQGCKPWKLCTTGNLPYRQKYQPGLNMQTTQALLPFYLLLVIMQQLLQGKHALFFPFPQQSHILRLKSRLYVALQIISKYPHHAHPLSHASWLLEHKCRNWSAEGMMQRHPSPRGSSAPELSPTQGLAAASWHWLGSLQDALLHGKIIWYTW